MSAECKIQTMALHWQKNQDEFLHQEEGFSVWFSPEPIPSSEFKSLEIDLNIHAGETVICTDVSDGCHVIDRPDHRYLSVVHSDDLAFCIRAAIERATF